MPPRPRARGSHRRYTQSVSEADDRALVTWAAEALGEKWPGAEVARVEVLRGDLSMRRFWRLHLKMPQAGAAYPATAILVDLGPYDLPMYARALQLMHDPPPEPPWINVHRYLSSIGVAVPDLYAHSYRYRALIAEDVGELSLFAACRNSPASTADLFRLAVDELLKIHIEGTRRMHHRCFASSINYNRQLFIWELSEFVEITLPEIAAQCDLAAVYAELDDLAERLDRYPRVLSHRDYHGQNLYLQSGPRLRVIDFQDALMAPNAHDLAVLLTTRDTGEIVSQQLERRLLDYYYAGLARRQVINIGMDDFFMSYRLSVIQHALKMSGRFMMFERDGKHGYAQFVPHTLGEAGRMLADMRAIFPALCAALEVEAGAPE
jgi:N-acetylmuramate 1-kinase